MTVKKIENVAGIVDPMSLNEFRLAVSSGQTMKSTIYSFNLILSLSEQIAELKDQVAELSKPAPPKRPSTKTASADKDAVAE